MYFDALRTTVFRHISSSSVAQGPTILPSFVLAEERSRIPMIWSRSITSNCFSPFFRVQMQ